MTNTQGQDWKVCSDYPMPEDRPILLRFVPIDATRLYQYSIVEWNGFQWVTAAWNANSWMGSPFQIDSDDEWKDFV